MKEIKGDLWTTPADVICITTNGSVQSNGKAVMGRGCALEAKTKFPVMEKWLGSSIKKYGNHVVSLGIFMERSFFSFPVKHNWWEKADIELIKRSCTELTERIEPWNKVLLPRPGCGNGRLKWEDVKKVIAPLLPDNVLVISNE